MWSNWELALGRIVAKAAVVGCLVWCATMFLMGVVLILRNFARSF